MVQSIVRDEKQLLPASAYLTGQYGIEDLYIGVPVRLGKDGVEAIIELDITDAERTALHTSAQEVRTAIKALEDAGVL